VTISLSNNILHHGVNFTNIAFMQSTARRTRHLSDGTCKTMAISTLPAIYRVNSVLVAGSGSQLLLSK